MIDVVLFWLFAALAVGSAFGVVFSRSIVYSALLLILVFLSIAGVFVLNNADFLAISQTIVYGVGLTIIILFGVMFTGDRKELNLPLTFRKSAAYMVVALMTLALLMSGVLQTYPTKTASPAWVAQLKAEGTTKALGLSLFQNHFLSFEIASVLLLLAMVGAILLAKKKFSTEPVAPSDVPSFQPDVTNFRGLPDPTVQESPKVLAGSSVS